MKDETSFERILKGARDIRRANLRWYAFIVVATVSFSIIAFFALRAAWDFLFPPPPFPYSRVWVLVIGSDELSFYFSFAVAFVVALIALGLLGTANSRWLLIRAFGGVSEELDKLSAPETEGAKALRRWALVGLRGQGYRIQNISRTWMQYYGKAPFGKNHKVFFEGLNRFGVRLTASARKRNLGKLVQYSPDIQDKLRTICAALAASDPNITTSHQEAAQELEASLKELGAEGLETLWQRAKRLQERRPVLNGVLPLLGFLIVFCLLFSSFLVTGQYNLFTTAYTVLSLSAAFTLLYLQLKKLGWP